MISSSDFQKKQIVIVFFNEGEKLAFSNDNMVIRNADGRIKLQCTCYRLFLIFAVGHCSITSVLLQNARKFGFFIAMMTPGFSMYALIGAEKDGNTLLKRRQYNYNGLEIARHIVNNKIRNQLSNLKEVRYKSEYLKENIEIITAYLECVPNATELRELLGYEGSASKLYFKSHFSNVKWIGRQPRLKRDYLNSVLDIGYSLLFAFVDALLESYGFDVYCGVMHTQFYMRKSLVCDLVEPFRFLIDKQVKKSINLNQIKEEDFLVINYQYKLKWEKSAEYARFLMTPLIENKEGIFNYIQSYYRAFMKELDYENYPVFELEGKNGNHKL